MDITNWIFSIEPQDYSGHNTPQATGPESWSVLRLPDTLKNEVNLDDRHRLGADLACLLSLALDRRVIVPVDLATQGPQQQEKIIFLPMAQIVDQDLLGPLPVDAKQRIVTYASAIAGLSSEDQEIIGAACTAYHGALLLFDKEPRAAYTLLVAGIEVLSRQYGSPPTEWKNWEASSNWDKLFSAQCLTVEQIKAIREQLMSDRQLRLGATFREYGSTRPRDCFWDKPLEQWICGIDANTGAWSPSTKALTRRIADLLPRDRTILKNSLAESYKLRSSVVHEAKWVELMTLQPMTPQNQEGVRALSFPVLRVLLSELIWIEIVERTSPVSLPDFQLLRQLPDTGRAQ
ncbi:MAG: hypothetical protein Q8K59_12120 [Nitrosomonas sp.]|nr:hypothetical protein [Nitrosomonas sp.]MDP1951810.1 hypothetical protein [Nitrosomonas sp.]